MGLKTENDLSRKIKQLRLEKGMTLEQVATMVGVGKSTIRKWETGMIVNMKSDKISSLAKALGITPAYLMGWNEDSKKADSTDALKLTDRETVLVELFRRVPEIQQQMVLEMVRVVLMGKRSE